MAKFFATETKSCAKDVPKRLTCIGGRKLNERISTVFVILVLVPVYADITPRNIKNVKHHTSDEFLRFEIINPTLTQGHRDILDTRLESGFHVNDLILHYHVNGEHVILDLTLNHNLIPHNHFMRYQLPNGSDAIQHFTETDIDLCHYKGTIRNNNASHAAISTCYGVKGVIFDGNETYYIDTKLNGNISDEHYLYRHSDRIQNQSNNSTCGIANNENVAIESLALSGDHHKVKRSADQLLIRGPSRANRESSFVELVLVVDNSIYKSFGRDIRKIHHYCKDIANILNAMYVPLNIFIILVGVSVWNEKDRIHLSKSSDKTLESFLQHRREVLMLEHPNDNAHLLTNQKFERSVIGHAMVNAICSYRSSGGITNMHSPSVSIVAATVAHELGHNFGMHHDTENCECEKPPCIMGHAVTSNVALHWSSCSKNQLDDAVHRGLLQCLRNKPTEFSINAICGNGFVEPGEECDCGLPEFCVNSCCDANTCKLRPNASCATGECCDLATCSFRTQGTVCRTANGDCDLAEYCSGESEYCTENIFKRDTELCGDGNAYCYKGVCRSHTDQCKLLWGESGQSVDQCYRKNLKGDSRGNCGRNWTKNTFKKCAEKDLMCGQLQCKPPTDSNDLEKSSRVQVMRGYSPLYPYFHCQAAIIDVGLFNVDPGLSPNGAKCAEGKMCVDQKCLSIESLRANGVGIDCPENCNGHGICDNKGVCHCADGYEPPLCNSTLQTRSDISIVGLDCPQNCSGHGICDNKGVCHCADGYEPPLCNSTLQTRSDISIIGLDCPQNCSGHGTCDNKGVCHCDDGYEPPLCNLTSQEVYCPENCSGHGICDNKGACHCDDGYEPPLCNSTSQEVDCPENCSGHGVCDNKGACHCDDGYEPPLCNSTSQEVDCPENCNGHGICDNKGVCHCADGYEPPPCNSTLQTRSDISIIGLDCPQNCSGHGTCDNKGVCHCDDGYEPPLCNLTSQEVNCPENCSGHGICDNKGACHCDDGYEPPLCNSTSQEVDCPENCSGHGVCDNKGACRCYDGYEPPLCNSTSQTRSDISVNGLDCPLNCSGHGTCDNKGVCHCDDGYEPPLCNLTTQEVNCPENCNGHGICDNKGACHCADGYEPPLCNSTLQTLSDISIIGLDCPQNCSGHGICDNKGACHCDDGYEPPLCNSTSQTRSDISVNGLDCPQDCSGHGVCDNKGVCRCDDGYEPPLCNLTSQKIYCPENCSGNGICDNKGACRCYNGYEPPLCNLTLQKWSDISEPSSTLNSNFFMILKIFILLFVVIIIFTLYMRTDLHEIDGQESLMRSHHEDM